MVTPGNRFVKGNFKNYFKLYDWRVAQVFDYVFYTYFAEGREHFVYAETGRSRKKEKDFPFLESLLRFTYLDIWSLENEFKKMDKALLDFYKEPAFDSQTVVMSTLTELASQHIYFEFLRLDWQARFHYAEQHPDEDIHTILPHKQLSHIPSTIDMLQKQIMRLFQDVLDIDDGKKKPAQEKLQAYLDKEKTHPLYAYKFQPVSTVYERIDKGSFAETLHPASLYDLVEFSLRECVKREQRMRICSYCGKYFAIPRRNTAEFCTLTVDENGHTCKEVGAMRRWAEKKNSDELFKEYRREYKKRFNWIKAGKISPGTFYAWSAVAKGKRDECAEGKMNLEEFKKWLSES